MNRVDEGRAHPRRVARAGHTAAGATAAAMVFALLQACHPVRRDEPVSRRAAAREAPHAAPLAAPRSRDEEHDRPPAPQSEHAPARPRRAPATAPLGPRRPPALFRAHEPADPDRAALHAVITALRARFGEWRRCWTEEDLCSGAEPARVEVAFTVHADGSITDVVVERVTRYSRADSSAQGIQASEGDEHGPLARCVADIVRTTTTAAIVGSGGDRWRVRYRFAPDLVTC